MTSGIPDHFKTQEMCNKVVEEDPCSLEHIPDYFRTQDMCNKTLEEDPCSLEHVPDHLKTQDMYIEAVIIKPLYWSMSLIILRPKKCVTRQLE